MSSTCEEVQTQQDVPDLVPARMLNEFAYCPRLAYLEWVQGEFSDNVETLEGRFGHRRVDRPDRQEVPEPKRNGPHPGPLPEVEGTCSTQPETIHSRSVMLSAPNEKLIAKIDVLDLENSVAVPIDYKRGRVPDVPGGAWEPERVQLCAQGLMLRENGYQCEGGILYYIESRRRISIPFDELLVERTRELVVQLRAMAAEGRMPLPLDDSPKCPRCSLVGICLPDETRLLAFPSLRPGDHDIRRLTPARDDALPLYIQEQGVTLGRSEDQLTVKSRQQTLRKVKMIDVSQVCLFGNVQVTAQALRDITSAGIPVCHFSYGGWFHALTRGMSHKNVELRIRQFAVAADPLQSLAFAKQFVLGKIKNCRTLLRRHLPEAEVKTTCAPLARLFHRAQRASSIESLLGIEGMAAKIYFAGFARMLKGADDFNIDGRNRRPPRDPTNALLSFVYRISYRRVLEVQARLLGRVLLGEINQYPNFCTR